MNKNYNTIPPRTEIKNHVYIGYYPQHEVGGLLKIGETGLAVKRRVYSIKSKAKEPFKVLLYLEYTTPNKLAKSSRRFVEAGLRFWMAKTNNKLHWIDSMDDHFYYDVEKADLDRWVDQFRGYCSKCMKILKIKEYTFKNGDE